MLLLGARAALIIFLVWAASIVFEPNHDAARLEVAADALEHGLMTFGLVVLISAALPKMRLLLIGLGVLGLGISLELLQLSQLVPGRFELGDIVADLTGISLGLFAVGVGEARTHDTQNQAERHRVEMSGSEE